MTPLLSSYFSFLQMPIITQPMMQRIEWPLAVAAYAKLGQGFVVGFLIQNFAINGMINQGSNREFINKIVYIGGGVAGIY